jgi:uncharacterized protein YdhG (YjbR/CyaY superfamily)
MTDERIDEHIRGFTERQQAPLWHIRGLLRELVPAATETIKYNMPSFTVQGKGLVAFSAFTDHWSYFPMSGSVIDTIAGLPDWIERDKGTLRIPLNKKLTKPIVKKLVRARLDEISAVADGKRFEFYDDATVKAEGTMKQGLLHGAWKFWRQDGTLMRSGRFAAGEPVGLWETWDRSGGLVAETRRYG